MVIKAGVNQDNDKQRTPEFYQRDGIPIPEKDVLDPVAEYNRGELDAMNSIEEVGCHETRNRLYEMLANSLEVDLRDEPDYIQGYADALETIAQEERVREI